MSEQDDIKIKIDVDGADTAARGLKSVGDAAKQTGEAAASGGLKLQQLTGSFGILSGAVGQVNPQLGELGRVLSTGVGQMGQMASASSMLGGSIAALATAFSIVTRAIKDSGDAMREAERIAIATAPTFDSIFAQIQRHDAETARIRRMANGQGTSQEYAAQEGLSSARQRDLQAAINGDPAAIRRLRASGMGNAGHARGDAEEFLMGGIASAADALGFGGAANRLRVDQLDAAEVERASAEIERLAGQTGHTRALAAAAERTPPPRSGAAPRARRGGGGSSHGTAESDASRAAGNMGDSDIIGFGALSGGLSQLGQQMAQGGGKNEVALADAQARREQSRRQETLRQEGIFYRERRQQAEEYYAALEEKGAAVGAALGDVLTQVASGQATIQQAISSVFKQAMAELAKSESVKAIASFAEAAGALASYQYPAAAKFAEAGALHLVAAGAAGGALAIASGAGSSGGGGGGPARPTRSAQSRDNGGGNVVINMNAPSISAGTNAELGRVISRAVRHGERRFGWGEGGEA